MMPRYRLAPALLLGHRARRLFSGPPAAGFRILLFHDLPAHLLPAFGELVAELKQTCGLLTPRQAETWLRGTVAPPRESGRDTPPCLLSFDDGFASNLELARSVLASEDVKALFFVLPGLIDLPAAEQRAGIAAEVFRGRHHPAPDQRLMSWEEIRELAAMGHTVGAHGMTHRRLSDLRDEALRREVLDAGTAIEERLGGAVTWYAHAFGHIDALSAEALAVIREGYRYCRSGVRGLNTTATSPHALRADHIDPAAPPAWGRLVLEGGLDGRYRRARRRLDAMAAPLLEIT